MSTCTLCGQHVLWLKNSAGKRAPVNPKPVASGDVVLEENATRYRMLTKAERAGEVGLFADIPEERYVLHFATCPHADKFRRCGTCHHTPCTCKEKT